jgi:hypothetical protein
MLQRRGTGQAVHPAGQQDVLQKVLQAADPRQVAHPGEQEKDDEEQKEAEEGGGRGRREVDEDSPIRGLITKQQITATTHNFT